MSSTQLAPSTSALLLKELLFEVEQCRQILLHVYSDYPVLTHPKVLQASCLLDQALATYLRALAETPIDASQQTRSVG